jgi:ribosomal protein L6P/L9E
MKRVSILMFTAFAVLSMLFVGCKKDNPTLTLTPSAVTISDSNLSATVAVSGTAQGAITLSTTPPLPVGVTAAVNGSTITITGVRQTTNAITGTYTVAVTREGITQNITVNVNLTTDTIVPLTLSPSTVNINDSNLTAIVEVGGAATGNVTLITIELPEGVTAAVSGTTITVTGVRPTTDVPAITGTFNVGVTRGGVTQNIAVTVNLTTTWVDPNASLTLSPSTVDINDGNLTASVEVGGTATGDIELNTSSLPEGVTATVSGTTITVTGVRPNTDVPAIMQTVDIAVTRGGETENLRIIINLTTTWVSSFVLDGIWVGVTNNSTFEFDGSKFIIQQTMFNWAKGTFTSTTTEFTLEQTHSFAGNDWAAASQTHSVFYKQVDDDTFEITEFNGQTTHNLVSVYKRATINANLNGTWGNSDTGTIYEFNNGIYERSVAGTLLERGTWAVDGGGISGGDIFMTVTALRGELIDASLQSWVMYTRADASAESISDATLNTLFTTKTVNYSISGSGDTLTIDGVIFTKH